MHGTGRSVERVEFGHSCVFLQIAVVCIVKFLCYEQVKCNVQSISVLIKLCCTIGLVDAAEVEQRLKMLVYRLHLITAIQNPPEQNQHQAQSIW